MEDGYLCSSEPSNCVIDTDNDGVPDTTDVDDDNDGIPDVEEDFQAINGGDTDGDGIPDRVDLDSDNDGIPDVIEGGSPDTDGDGMVDPSGDGNNDDDGDGLIDTADPEDLANGVPGTPAPTPDTDGDGADDYIDLDSDNDSVPDTIEGGQGCDDMDGNAVCDGPDTDMDGLVDSIDPVDGHGGDVILPLPDKDAGNDPDNKPDYLDVDNDITDVDDIDAAGSGPLDGNNDGVIDDPADNDGDGLPNLSDDDPTFGGSGAPDTDGDGIFDNIDVDDDNDGIPDDVEMAFARNGGDTDGDGIPDVRDLDSDDDGIVDSIEAGHNNPDADNNSIVDGPYGPNGLADSIETGPESGDSRYPLNSGDPLAPVDTDGDGRPDYVDLDSDNDTISDLIEGGQAGTDSTPVDADANGVVDAPDNDGDGVPNSVDGDDGFGDPNNPPLTDKDQDGKPDFREKDSNGDNTPDIVDAGNAVLDGNGDGVPDNATDVDQDGILDVIDDSDGDGTPDINDPDAPSFGGLNFPPNDSDGDGIPDSVEGCNVATDDFDGDGLPNCLDDDADGDGIHDSVESGTNPEEPDDFDGDGQPNYLDLDSDNDGINDVWEGGGVDNDDDGQFDNIDDNGDGVADEPLTPADDDFDGQPDYLDLDSDNDTISDLCEGGQVDLATHDANNDGVIDGGDADNDGIQDAADGLPNQIGDANSVLPLPDADFDGEPDYIDVLNHIFTVFDIDGPNGTPELDSNSDGRIDDKTDTDGDGIADVADQSAGFGGLGKPVDVSFTNWQATTTGAGTTPLSNNDGDMFDDLCEYVFGSDPATGLPVILDENQEPIDGVTAGLCSESVDHQTVNAVFRIPANRPDIAYVLELSGDLENWEQADAEQLEIDHEDGTLTLKCLSIETESDQVDILNGYARVRGTLTRGAFAGATCFSNTVGWCQATLYEGLQTYGYNWLEKPVFGGIVSGVTSTTITVETASIGQADVSQDFEAGKQYIIEVIEGTMEGHRFEVDEAATNGSTIALDNTGIDFQSNRPYGHTKEIDASSPMLANRILIRPHVTLGSVFETSRLTGGGDASEVDNIELFDPVSQSYVSYYLIRGGGIEHWARLGHNPLESFSGMPLAPGTGVFYKRVGADVLLLHGGSVRENDFIQPLGHRNTLITNGYPLDMSPVQRDLRVGSGFIGSGDTTQADTVLTWQGDFTRGLTAFDNYYLLPNPFDKWIEPGDNPVTVDKSTLPLFNRCRAAFINRRNAPLDDYRIPAPWSPLEQQP